MKKSTKKIIAIFTGASLATMLVACSPNKHSEPKREYIETVQTEKKEDVIDKEEQSINEKYIEELKEYLNETKEFVEDKWDSEEALEKRKIAREKLKELIDFTFNGKEINGITFSELKEEEKEKIMSHMQEFDEYVDYYIPDYKDRFKNWISEKKADFKEWLIDKSTDAKELWEEYKQEVNERYESRQR